MSKFCNECTLQNKYKMTDIFESSLLSLQYWHQDSLH